MSTEKANPGKMEVKVSAIDGDFLVLQSLSGDEQIRWPLNNISTPLDIGSTFILELKTADMALESLDTEPSSKGNSRDDENRDEARRRLLEQLVN